MNYWFKAICFSFDLVNCTESCVKALPQCPACGEAINQCLVDGKCDGFFTGCMACVLKATKPCVGCGAGMKKCFKGCQWT